MSLKHQIARKEIIEAGRQILESALVIGTWGNISVRVPEDELIAITPSGVDYNRLIPENIPIMDFEGNLIDGNMTPSIELAMHLEIYKNRPDINAIVHTHSTYCTAMAIARQPIPAACEDLIQIVGGAVRVAEYKLPGTLELGKAAVLALEDRNAVLLANHGLLAAGKDLKETLKIAHICEKSAHATLLAANIGGAVSLSKEDCAIMRDFYLNKYGQR
ncbi:class II aldolase/adducin family protein [Fusibacter tunisiensis]|uniref:L-fuculose-phosphate aldolase n=1 Tax=Fusibacter tunisiensis TaxID=1008308 RepID=A0ABS2MQH7_9FIRM|nr:class II aldolase/adducin family protein [Fusibacter tunisiensis]MBM7561635.1 L-fuculose-phosphate aldolase [Fusibacter tunisiensis]